jgi:Acyl-coenzyme A:6-aminopenicillanic acid acyl-transferase
MSGAPPCRLDVICTGSAHSMGQQQGEACREKLALIDSLLPRLEAFRLAQPRWLPSRLFRRMAESRATRLVRRPLLRDDAESHARLEGISRGSGTRLRLLYLVNALECLMASPRRCTVNPPLAACLAVAVRGSRSATGGPVIARNFDYLPLVQPLYALRESRASGRFRSLDFTLAPLAGAVDGINERGLCITYDYGFAIDDGDGTGPPISAAISAALARAATVSEAAALIMSRPRWGGGLLMLADAEGDIASLELSTTRSELRRPPPGEDLLYHTNAFHTDSMQAVQVSGEAMFTPRAPAPLRNKRPLDSSRHRDARFAKLLAQHPRLGWDELTAVMSDHGDPGDADAHGLCVHSDYWYTTAALQLDPRQRTMRIAYASTCQAEFREFQI